jgi:Ca2+-binding RTX toxin-like protein
VRTAVLASAVALALVVLSSGSAAGGAGSFDARFGTGGKVVTAFTTGEGGRDVKLGHGGNDVLNAGAGNNLMNGGPGLDTCRGQGRRISCEKR